MKTLFLLAVFLITFFSCKDQKDQNKATGQNAKTINFKGSKDNSKPIIKVNKQYDSNGNLIKYDSIYSFYHTSKGRDSVKIALDSVFENFKSTYKNDFRNLLDKNFNELFLSDSLFKYDFPNEDYFKKRYELNTKKFDELFRKMDSLKLNFLNKTNSEPPANIKRKKSSQ
jgi:hypothetical protein